MRPLLKPWDRTGYAALLASLVAGLYVSVFYTLNNLTMLRGGDVLFIFGIMIVPLSASTLLVYYPLHVVGKGDWARWIVAFMISAFLLIALRPSLVGIDFVGSFFGAFPAERRSLANLLFIVVPSGLLALIFHRKLREYAAILGIMTLTATLMGSGQFLGNGAEITAGRKLSPQLQQLSLEKKPNIYFILADAYSSLAFMKDYDIDVSDFTGFLSDNGFRLYEDTYSNYQPTTSAMPAILNMEHHYYRLSGHRINFSEVDKTSRKVIGGDNNVSHILKMNGYSIQYIHNGNYLLLQGCSADSCYPQIDGLAGARLILSQMFKVDLLSKQDKAWKTTTSEEMRARVRELMDDDESVPRFQYIHSFSPGHPSNRVIGRCNEKLELAGYASRVREANDFFQRLISDIIDRDPDAVIVFAGDHGPLISKRCSRSAYIDNVSEYRDRAGAIMAIRWPSNYDGRYDDRISSGVNLFRYVLASLAEDASPLLRTVAPDDVFVRADRRIFKVIENGVPLETPSLIERR
jgi:hypothetical protein